ncbi:MAG: hypothetical protein K0Q79_468 [Flavipsychrobacter sp.]|jgi:hypothetical protein|nr:hypothetical protein [Flavipsychrobacter sp.]
MKKLLLLISFVWLSGAGYAQQSSTKTKTAVTQKKTVFKKKRKVKKKKYTQREVVHRSPDQAKLDSMKKAKTLQKK